MILGLIIFFGGGIAAYILFTVASAASGMVVLGILSVCAVLFVLNWLLAPFGLLGDLIVIAFLVFAAVMITKKLYIGIRTYFAKVNRSVKAERQRADENYKRKQQAGKF